MKDLDRLKTIQAVMIALPAGVQVYFAADHPINRIDELLPWNCAMLASLKKMAA